MTASNNKTSNASSTSTATLVAPSALNVYNKIAVVRSVDDTLHYEVDGSVKTVSVQDLGDAISIAVRNMSILLFKKVYRYESLR
jgi:hypothetical protein